MRFLGLGLITVPYFEHFRLIVRVRREEGALREMRVRQISVVSRIGRREHRLVDGRYVPFGNSSQRRHSSRKLFLQLVLQDSRPAPSLPPSPFSLFPLPTGFKRYIGRDSLLGGDATRSF